MGNRVERAPATETHVRSDRTSPPPAHTSCSSASALQEGCPLWAASAMLGVNDVVAKSSDENLKTTSCTPEALGEGLPWQ